MKHYIIPIFIPHLGCPHQCVFCNQRKITGVDTNITQVHVYEQLEYHFNLINKPRYVEVAFYGGSFTALPMDTQAKLLTPAYEALKKGKVHGIRLSTRPDCISSTILDTLLKFGVSTIELGVQSMDDKVLAASARGHTSNDVFSAVELIKKTGTKLGLQVMLGLPKENWQSIIKTGNNIVQLKPDIVRIYPTLVIRDTPLACLYLKGEYTPLTLQQAISRSAYLKGRFEQNDIKVIRTGLQATEELGDPKTVLAGPYHPSFGELVDSFVYYLRVSTFLESLTLSKGNKSISLHYHYRDESKVRGLNKRNLQLWRQNYRNFNILLKPDMEQSGCLFADYQGIKFDLSKNSPG